MLNPSAANFGFSNSLLRRTRPDSLLITKAYEDNNRYAKAVFELAESYRVISGDAPELEALATQIFDSRKEVAERISAFFRTNEDYAIQSIDTSRISVPDSVLSILDLTDEAKLNVRNKGVLRLSFNHVLRDQRGEPIMDSEGNLSLVKNQPFDESMGTRRLFSILVPLIDTVRLGRSLYIDEFGAFLHPSVSKKILDFFRSESEGSSAQLFINAQDYSLMDSLMRNEITLIEKDSFERSHASRLEDFNGVRKNESFRNAYIHGKYGALPKTDFLE